MNSFCFFLSRKLFICPSVLNDSFVGQNNLGCRSLLRKATNFISWNVAIISLVPGYSFCQFFCTFYSDDHVTCEQDSFMSSFSICKYFISFCCLIALAGTSSTKLKGSGERIHTCFVPVWGKNFRLIDIWNVCILGWSLAFSDFYSHTPMFKRNVSAVITYRYHTHIPSPSNHSSCHCI